LPGSDPRLGPEMKSTGEVMGTAGNFGKAYQKAQMAVGKPIPLEGTALVDMPILGFEEHFETLDLDDFEDSETVVEAIQNGEIDLVVSREREILEACVEETVTYFSTLESAEAALEAINSADDPLNVQAIGDRPKDQRQWGK
jgi:carbamoyl-phosphate synthase large subunit